MKAPALLTQLKLLGLPDPEPEYRFLPSRRFRLDLCWLEYKVAFEFEGGTWKGGRHVQPQGYARDVEKYNLAALGGWLLVRAVAAQVESGQAAAWIEQALRLRGWS